MVIGPYMIACSLISRGKWVHVRKLGISDRHHLDGGIEFHGARTKRNHTVAQ
jgi:hypothetical protein